MKLIVGLGNPGQEHHNTRHNIGFMIVDNYAKEHNFTWKQGYQGEYIKEIINNETVILYKPWTFMNLSGMGIFAIANYFNIPIEDIFVIYDDINFKLGEFKIKYKGSSGGHNGIKNIIEVYKTEVFSRVKVGISKPSIRLSAYVLQQFKPNEIHKLAATYETLNKVIDDFIRNETIDHLMTKYNVK